MKLWHGLPARAPVVESTFQYLKYGRDARGTSGMPRQALNLNRDWRFFRGECADAARPSFDDTDWQRIGLPHCFDLPYFRTPEFYVGEGWYRRTLPALDGHAGHVLFDFDGVFQCCDVYLNGNHIGSHKGGYTGFLIDAGPVRATDNTLSIRVDNRWNPQLAPRAGEHIFSGGIYRDVRMTLVGDIYIPPAGHAIQTPHVSQRDARVRVTTELHSGRNRPANVQLRSSILTSDDRIVATMLSTVRLGPNQYCSVEQPSGPISSPLLWHPDHPHLYRAVTEVIGDGLLIDRVESTFGFRTVEWTADRGFFLNGEHLYLRGANAHQDHAGWGIGITHAACERDVRLIKEAGFNFVRGAHYPHHPAFAEACDRLGLLFWSEATFWGKGGFGPEGYWNASAYPVNEEDARGFEKSCLQQLEEMIRQNRNHPSIIAWSMTNEAFFTYHLDRARDLMRTMVARSQELDPTRPAAIGGAQRGNCDKIGDVAGYNGDGARLFINPGVPNMVSEYGAISKPVDAFDPFFGDLQPEQFPWRAGQAIWCAFDYGSIAGKQGLKGILTHARVPKQSWHWYRQNYLGIAPPSAPVPAGPNARLRIKLDADKTIIQGTDATDDVQITITIVNDDGTQVKACPILRLSISSGPGEFPTGRSITFQESTDISLHDGQGAIAFRSYHGGETVIRAASPGLAEATLTITTLGAPVFEPGVTPQCEDRPYVPPTESESARLALRNAVNIALNRPSRASTELPDHPARQANDGDATTAWHAAPGDGNPWWLLDLEGFYDLASIKLAFPAAGNWRFFVDTSTDRETWSPAINRRESVNLAATRVDVFDPGLSARYLRLTFTNVPGESAGLAEVEVYGILSR